MVKIFMVDCDAPLKGNLTRISRNYLTVHYLIQPVQSDCVSRDSA